MTGFNAKLCGRACNSMDGTSHKINIGHYDVVKDGEKIISLSTQELREKYEDHDRIQETTSI
jgi:hypothetical protein